jgi:Ser/Thr protein kinase RdoA (MazF antagonist)
MSSAGPAAGRQIGAILGRIHRLSLDISNAGAPGRLADTAEWCRLSEAVLAGNAPWASSLAAILPRIAEWESAGLRANLSLGEHRVTSHGDLDQKNVLWSNNGHPWLIDWESAGPVQPAVEVIAAALDWSGQTACAPDRETFSAVLAAYRSVADLSAEGCRLALDVRLADWLSWLKANMERSMDIRRSKEEQELGAREAAKTIATLRSLSDNREALAKWCDE